MRQPSEKFYEKKNRAPYNNFIDFKEAFDVVAGRAIAGVEKLRDTATIGSTARKLIW